MTVQSQTPTELVEGVYANLENRLSAGRKTLNIFDDSITHLETIFDIPVGLS